MQKRYRRPKPNKSAKRYWVNEQIRIPRLHLIGPSGENFGVMATAQALAKAREFELDLVEINPTTQPPVAKIMDWGQFKYEKEKKEKKMKASQKKSDVKGVRLTFRIKGHDLENRVKQTKDFLAAGHKVKVELNLKGREKAHKALAREIINDFISQLGEQVKVIQPLSAQGGRFNMIITY